MGMGLCLGTRERAAVAHVEDVDDKAQARGLCVCLGGALIGAEWGGGGWGGIHRESYDECHDDRELKRGRARGVGSGRRLGASARGLTCTWSCLNLFESPAALWSSCTKPLTGGSLRSNQLFVALD